MLRRVGKWGLGSVGAIVVLALLVHMEGCGGPKERVGPPALRFWALGREGEVVQQLLPGFQRRYPEIKIEIQQVPWSAAHEKLLTAYVGGATPDLAQVGNTWIPEFVALGALADLTSATRSQPGLAPGGFFPGVFETNLVQGSVYGIPWYVDTRLLFFRTDLLRRAGFEAPPRTWSEWRTMMSKIHAQAPPGASAVLLPIDEWTQPVIFGLQNGASLLREGGRFGAFEERRFRAAFEFYVDIFRRRWAPSAGNTQIANLYQQFAQGDFAFYISGPWNLGEFRRRLPPGSDDLWSTAPLPAPDGVTYPGASLAGGSSLVVFKRSRLQREALAWIEYLSEPEQQARFYTLTGDLPARQAAWDSPALARDPKARAFFEQIRAARPLPPVPEWEQIAQKVREWADAVVRGGTSIDQALAGLDRDTDQILEKRRFLLDQRRGRR